MKIKLIVLAMCLSTFVCMMDTTIMNIALPKIQTSLNTTLNNVSWTLNIYTIVFAAFTIPLSRLADRFGRNKSYITGLIIFLIGSILCGTSHNFVELVIYRGIQSIGAAIVFPISMVIAVESVSKVNKEKVIAFIGIAQGLAAALGPSLGGILTEYFDWEWIFYINIPLILICLQLSFQYLETKKEPIKDEAIDLTGSFLSMIFLGTLTFSLIKVREWGWDSKGIIILFVFSALILLLFLISQIKSKNPMLSLKLFKNRNFSAASITMILSNIFLVGVMVILPSFLTILHNKSEIKAAILITPISAMIFIITPFSSLIIKKIENKYVVMTGFLLILLSYFIFIKMTADEYYLYLIVGCIILGVGYGMIIGPLTIIAASSFVGKDLTASQGVIGVFRQMGIILAIAIYISSLTLYTNEAKINIKKDSKYLIETLNLSNKDKEIYYKKVSQHIDNNSKTNDNSSLISRNKQDSIIKQKYNEVEKKLPDLKNSQKIEILDKIKKEVTKKSNQINKDGKEINNKIMEISERKINEAYLKVFSKAIPFIIISIFISLLFKKIKKKVRDCMKSRGVILGLLNKKPRTGYELNEVFQSVFTHFFDGSFGMIYPTLKALEKEEKIKKR
nr:DHA2 family efflux MFS transporter permease subunit [Staphylococcus sp. NRL 22/194]